MPPYFFHLAIDLARPSERYLATATASSSAGTSSLATAGADSGDSSDISSGGNVATGAGLSTTDSLLRFGGSTPAVVHRVRTDADAAAAAAAGTSSSLPLDVEGAADADDDWRAGDIRVQRIDMAPAGARAARERTTVNVDSNAAGATPAVATQGRFEPLTESEASLGWGVVRLYREQEATPGLYDEVGARHGHGHSHGRNGSRSTGAIAAANDTWAEHSRPDAPWPVSPSPAAASSTEQGDSPSFTDGDCTTLCILAVPSYLTPADFLGFVGEKTREEVSHFRMIRTDRANRYMVLMKFRSGKKAREWRRAWNGTPFNDLEAENCHVVFIKSIQFRTRSPTPDYTASFPDMTHDPFTPTPTPRRGTESTSVSRSSHATLQAKPVAPPTPALKELPTCPVCLERMDESTGLLTILCQHVFHCACLEKWRGSGCPVCRYTQNGSAAEAPTDGKTPKECAVCRSDVNLWACLVCGHVGCGRYDGKHAFVHYHQTRHCFAMDLASQRVWDYDSDGYVHRIMQSKSDARPLELPAAAARDENRRPTADDSDSDSVPRAKLEALGLEYTHLLTSQLDSQRLYFEAKLERAADKASEATAAAESAATSAASATASLAEMQTKYDVLIKDTLPDVERERDRAARKAERFETMARKLEKEWRDEKAVAEGLVVKAKALEEQVGTLSKENEDLKEMNRDMSFFISGQQKLQEMQKDLGDEEDITQGTASVPEEKKRGKGKGRRK